MTLGVVIYPLWTISYLTKSTVLGMKNLFKLMIKEVQENHKLIWAFVIAFCCLQEVKGKSLLLKTLCTLYRGLRGIKDGCDLKASTLRTSFFSTGIFHASCQRREAINNTNNTTSCDAYKHNSIQLGITQGTVVALIPWW